MGVSAIFIVVGTAIVAGAGIAMLLPAGLLAGPGLFFTAKTFAIRKAATKGAELAKLVDTLADRVSESRSRI